jgi:predicted ArsR family transcriptional regulator
LKPFCYKIGSFNDFGNLAALAEQLIFSDRSADRLLMILKMRGTRSTSELAAELGISVPGVRQHLNNLTEDGLVESRQEPRGVGRPAQRWSLCEAAQQHFPDTHAEITVALIDSIRSELGEEALDAVIDHRYRQTRDRYRRELKRVEGPAARLRRLAELRSEEGYMAELIRDGDDWLLIENHCPICAAAQSCQNFCRNELGLFQAIVPKRLSVVREEYLLEGARRCAYRISART